MLTLVPSHRDPQPRVAAVTLVPGVAGRRRPPWWAPAPRASAGPHPTCTEAPPN